MASWASYVAEVKQKEASNPDYIFESSKGKKKEKKKTLILSSGDDKSPSDSDQENKYINFLRNARLGSTTLKLGSSRESSEASTPRFSMNSESKSRDPRTLLSFLSTKNRHTSEEEDDDEDPTKNRAIFRAARRSKNQPPMVTETRGHSSSSSSFPSIITSTAATGTIPVPNSTDIAPMPVKHLTEPPITEPSITEPPTKDSILTFQHTGGRPSDYAQPVAKRPALTPSFGVSLSSTECSTEHKKEIKMDVPLVPKWEFQPPVPTSGPLAVPFSSPPGTPKAQPVSIPTLTYHETETVHTPTVPLAIETTIFPPSCFTMQKNIQPTFSSSSSTPSIRSTPRSIGRVPPSFYELKRRKEQATRLEEAKSLAWLSQSISTSATRPFGFIPPPTSFLHNRHSSRNAPFVRCYSTEPSLDSTICTSV